MKQMIIGLVGPMVSGKGDVAKYLESLGFQRQSLSDRVREESDLRGVERTRENLQDVGNDLREKFGLQVLAERTAELLASCSGNIVIDGIRNPGEIEFLKQIYDISIVGINAPVESRLDWYLRRAEKRGEDTATEEEFIKSNSRDYGIGEGSNGQQVGRCLEMADILIQNDGSKKHLIEEIEYLLILNGFSPEGARKSKEK